MSSINRDAVELITSWMTQMLTELKASTAAASYDDSLWLADKLEPLSVTLYEIERAALCRADVMSGVR